TRIGARLIAEEGAKTGTEYTSFWAFFIKHPAAFLCVWGSYTLMTFVAFAITPWAITMFVRKFGISPADAGLAIVGPIEVACGIGGCLVGGILGDQWTRSKVFGAKLRLLLVYWFASLPAVLCFTLGPTPFIAGAGYAFYFFFNSVAYAAAF